MSNLHGFELENCVFVVVTMMIDDKLIDTSLTNPSQHFTNKPYDLTAQIKHKTDPFVSAFNPA